MSASISLQLEILDGAWKRLALTDKVLTPTVEEELGSAESRASATIHADDPAAAYLPDPDDEESVQANWRLYEHGVLVFAGLIDSVKRDLTSHTITIGGVQRGAELAHNNVGRRDFLGWPFPSLVRELTRRNVGQAPFATVTASSEALGTEAINAITGEPQKPLFWSIQYTGVRPSTFVTAATITVDLGEAMPVHAVRVIPEWWENKWYKWQLQTSGDGSLFVTKYDKSDAFPTGDRGTLVEFDDTSVRYVRVSVYASSDGYPRIAGILTYRNIVDIGASTTYTAPWIENDDSPNITTTGTVTQVVQDGAFNGDGTLRNSLVSRLDTGATMTHNFRGVSNAVFLTQADGDARIEVSVDNVSQGQVYIPANSSQFKAFETTGLAAGNHTLKVSATAGRPQVDYFSGEFESSYRTVEEDEPAIGYTGRWQTDYDPAYSSQSVRYGDAAEDGFLFPFHGNSIKMLSTKGTDAGIFEWYIDGASQGTVDLYNASRLTKQTVVSWTGSYGAHTFRVRATGTKNASATSTRINVDRLEGNWAHNLYLRSAHDTNLALLGRLSEMTNTFLRLNYDGTVDLLGAVGSDTGEIIREGENEGGTLIEATLEGDYSNTPNAILALGRGSDNQALRVLVQDKLAIRRAGRVKVAKIENRDAVDAYLLVRQAWQTLQDSKRPKRAYSVTYDASTGAVGAVSTSDLIRLYTPRLGLGAGDRYRIFSKNTSWTAEGKHVALRVANKRDRLSDLLTRATRDLSVTTDTPQGFKNVTQYGGNAENFVAETGGSTFRSAEIDFYIDEDSVILDAKLRMRIGKYRSYERETTSGGGSTSGAGGGQTSSSTSTPSGGGDTSGAGNHRHIIGGELGTPGAFTTYKWQGNGIQFNLPVNAVPGDSRIWTYMESESGTEHTHATPNHTHPGHTHAVVDHSHTTPNHTHTQTYDIFEEGSYPGAVSVLVDGVNVDSVIGGPFIATSTTSTFDASLTGVITIPGWHTLRFEAASGKGRITSYIICKSLQLQ